MKKRLFLFLFIAWGTCFAQNGQVKNLSDRTDSLQNILNNPSCGGITLNYPIVINGILTVPGNKILRFEPGGKFLGKGIINGGVIEANYQSWIFDSTLIVNPGSVNQYFSVKWFGAGMVPDNSVPIQRAINTCIKNNIRTVFIPAGRYTTSHPLIIRGSEGVKEAGFCTLEILGESSFWDSNMGSEIHPDFNNTFAIGIQNGKGCKLRKLTITGLFAPPSSSDSHKFFNTSFENFTDGKCRDSRYSPYSAIVIDPFTNLSSNPMPADGGYPGLTAYYGKANNFSTQTGSTGTEIEELRINNFVVGICSSPNGLTRNAEISIINKIQFEDCKLCISGGQDQEKGNVVSNIYCWGGTHTIFATGLYGGERMAGNWNIDHANIAGAVVRFIYNDQHGYFPTYVSHVFAESLGMWGTVNSELACEISDCHIDFAYKSQAGDQNLLTSWGNAVVYCNCNFRYYGESTPMQMEGNCIFEYCFFSGKPVIKGDATFIKCSINGKMTAIQGSSSLLTAKQIIWIAIAAGIIIILVFSRKIFHTVREKLKETQPTLLPTRFHQN